MEKINLSVICVYNSLDKLNQYLLKSLKSQNVDVELILVDNQKNDFSSAASALNFGSKKASRDYLLFVHQDIVFVKENSLNKIYKSMLENKNSIFGLAGVRYKERGVITNLLTREDKRLAGSIQIKFDTKCDVLDECFLMLSKELFDTLKFDEKLCNGWDFYVSELCIRAGLNNINVYVNPETVWHVSPGNPSSVFYRDARKISKYYKNKIPQFRTCCISAPLNCMNWFVIAAKKYRLRIVKVFKN